MCRCHRSLLDYCGNSLRHFLFYASLSQDAFVKPKSINYSLQYRTTTKAGNATRMRLRCGCLMTDWAALSITVIIIIPITSGSHEHLRGTFIPDGALVAELTFGAGVQDGRKRCTGDGSVGTSTYSVVSARGYHGLGRYPCSPNEERRAGCRARAPPPSLPLRSRARAALGLESRIETVSL